MLSRWPVAECFCALHVMPGESLKCLSLRTSLSPFKFYSVLVGVVIGGCGNCGIWCWCVAGATAVGGVSLSIANFNGGAPCNTLTILQRATCASNI
jgi:hypothetical protein